MRSSRFLVVVLVLLQACSQAPEGPLDRVTSYQEFHNDQDIDGLVALYADSARLVFGPMNVIEGAGDIRAIHDYDRALNTKLQFENCQLEANRVTCQTTQTNDWLEAAGLERIEFTESAFTFDEADQIVELSTVVEPASLEAFGQALGAFDVWARANRPEEYDALFREDGSFNYSFETGERVLVLIRAWSAEQGSGQSESSLEQVERYQSLANQHDIEGLLALYAENARLDFGPMGVIEGTDQLRAIHDYDRAVNSELRFEDCQAETERVVCRAIETNDWLGTVGIERIVYTESAFTFDSAGQIAAVSGTLAPEFLDSLGVVLSEFEIWAQENRPEEYAALFREDGGFEYSYANGEAVLALLREWRPPAQE